MARQTQELARAEEHAQLGMSANGQQLVEQKLRDAAAKLPASVMELGHEAVEYKKSKEMDGDWSEITEQGELELRLCRVAYAIAHGNSKLTENISLYHTLGYASKAMFALQDIVIEAGYRCSVVGEANVFVCSMHPQREDIVKLLESYGAQYNQEKFLPSHFHLSPLQRRALRELKGFKRSALSHDYSIETSAALILD